MAPSNRQVKNKKTIDKIHIKLKINEICVKNLLHSSFNIHSFCNSSNLKIVTRPLRKYGYPGARLIVGVKSVSELGFCNEKIPLLVKLKEMLKYPSAGIFKSDTVLVQKKKQRNSQNYQNKKKNYIFISFFWIFHFF